MTSPSADERLALHEAQFKAANELALQNPWLFALPFINQYDDIGQATDYLAAKNSRDFNWAISFDEDFIAELMYNGFLTMCERLNPCQCVLLPKLHATRCVLQIEDLHIFRSSKKKAKRFSFSCDRAFDSVCNSIVEQHGENWFHKPLVAAFKKMNSRRVQGCFNGKVFMHSFELWSSETGALVAGEIGYSCGTCYTSLSGFSKVNSAGSVQMAATGALLKSFGFVLWDLGMQLDYKEKMGAVNISRVEFLQRLAACRNVSVAPYLKLEGIKPADDVIKMFPPKKQTGSKQLAPNPLSKKQEKKQAKRLRVLQRKAEKRSMMLSGSATPPVPPPVAGTPPPTNSTE
uniref:Leucyl/phenylalanyl-tRNA--protein transferase n=1 Tax=Mucochytrium quahogii TaxID=96639 RepID=A0A7S2WKL2_9STRA|mmetsp:Transcript_8205/g.13256  ORF Transcript_8205/g.13256 Transcript_8205/m.13256 type:complete len:346 (-) Transcript_8205:108-1145(-)